MTPAELDQRRQWLIELTLAPDQDPSAAEFICASLEPCPTAALHAWCALDLRLRVPLAQQLVARVREVPEPVRAHRLAYMLALARIGQDARALAAALEDAADQPIGEDAEPLVALFALLSLDPTSPRGVERLLVEAGVGRTEPASVVGAMVGPTLWRHLPVVSSVVFDAIERHLLDDRDGHRARKLAAAVARARDGVCQDDPRGRRRGTPSRTQPWRAHAGSRSHLDPRRRAAGAHGRPTAGARNAA